MERINQTNEKELTLFLQNCEVDVQLRDIIELLKKEIKELLAPYHDLKAGFREKAKGKGISLEKYVIGLIIDIHG